MAIFPPLLWLIFSYSVDDYLQSSRSRGFGSQSCCSPPSPASSASLLHQDHRNHLENSLQTHRHHITFFNRPPKIQFLHPVACLLGIRISYKKQNPKSERCQKFNDDAMSCLKSWDEQDEVWADAK